jgi:TRAP-type C4-dicarboxylate transport system permease small subunit
MEPDAGRGIGAAVLLRRVLGGVVALILFFMMVLTVIDVLGRFVFNKPVPGSFEMMEFSLAILVFTATPLVTWDRGHITVTLLDNLFRGHARRIQRSFVLSVSALAIAIICWRMWDQGNRLDVTGAITGYLEWPIAPVAWSMSLLAGLSFLIVTVLAIFAIQDRPMPEFDDHAEMPMD